MSALKTRLTADLRAKMLARDTFAVSVLRYVLSEISTKEKAGKTPVEYSDDQVLALLRTEVKKREETAEVYENAGRADAAATERKEVEFLNQYLPALLSREDVERIVDEKVTTLGETANLGAVMKSVMAEYGTVVDGKTVSEVVRMRLA